MHKLLILSRDALRYQDLWLARDTCKDAELVLSTSLPQDVINYQQAAEVTVLLTDPDLAVQVIEYLPNLVWCQSAWAGNAPLLQHSKQDYMLSGVKGIFAGVPVIIGKDGVEKIEEINLDEKEKNQFMHSIEAVKKLWDAASTIDKDLSK